MNCLPLHRLSYLYIKFNLTIILNQLMQMILIINCKLILYVTRRLGSWAYRIVLFCIIYVVYFDLINDLEEDWLCYLFKLILLKCIAYVSRYNDYLVCLPCRSTILTVHRVQIGRKHILQSSIVANIHKQWAYCMQTYGHYAGIYKTTT